MNELAETHSDFKKTPMFLHSKWTIRGKKYNIETKGMQNSISSDLFRKTV